MLEILVPPRMRVVIKILEEGVVKCGLGNEGRSPHRYLHFVVRG